MNQTPQRILLVEDDEDDQYFMQVALDKAGVRAPIMVVNNGRDAIAYLTRAEPFADPQKFFRPSLILLDLKMPYVSGFEVLEWLRSRGSEFSDIAVIVLTSSPEERDQTRAYQLGARSYLLKPPTEAMIVDIFNMLALRPPANGTTA